MSLGGLYYPAYTPGMGSKPRFQSVHPFRNLVAAGTNQNTQWSGGSGHSGYGVEPPEYDYHSGPPAHVPSGGSYSYQAATGTGYGPPVHPVHSPVKPPTGGGKKGGKKGSSAISALTLLSFLFFINLLQGCIKDHMDAINPTVMVLPTNIIRNRFNKMGDMNSREQTTAASSSFSSNAANIVMKPEDLVAAAAAHSPGIMDATQSTVSLQSPYSSNTNTYHKPMEQHPPPPQPVPSYTKPETDIQIHYPRPYDHNQPDPYENYRPQPSVIYANHTLHIHSPPLPPVPPPYQGPQLEHHYNYHHTEYHNDHEQPPPAVPQYTTSTRYPQYEYQYPSQPINPYTDDNVPEYTNKHHEYKFPSKYNHQTQSMQTSHNSRPWSSSHTSASSSVVSGPFRRASIISVSPNAKWITVPAVINEHSNFEEHEDEVEEEDNMEQQDDREVYHKRLN